MKFSHYHAVFIFLSASWRHMSGMTVPRKGGGGGGGGGERERKLELGNFILQEL